MYMRTGDTLITIKYLVPRMAQKCVDYINDFLIKTIYFEYKM